MNIYTCIYNVTCTLQDSIAVVLIDLEVLFDSKLLNKIHLSNEVLLVMRNCFLNAKAS